MGIETKRTDSRESSRSRWGCHSSQAQYVSAGRELSQHASRLRVTRREVRYRTMCERSPAGGRKRGGRSEVGLHQCKSRHHEGSMPGEHETVSHTRLRHERANNYSIPSLPREANVRSHYPVPISGCYREFLATKTAQRHPSCVQFCPEQELERAPIVMALVRHRIPCRHGSRSWERGVQHEARALLVAEARLCANAAMRCDWGPQCHHSRVRG
jgi:hypothetical protein